MHESDNDLSDLEKRNRRDKDGESSKSKKKHKKHKKNKKSKKYDVDGKEKHNSSSSSKKHKKHHKRTKSSDDYSSDSNAESAATTTKTKIDTMAVSSRHDSETKPPPPATTTLNTKFTEIMKSNGHVVVAKIPVTKYNNGNGADASTKRESTNKIPTDPNKLVEFITKSLDPNTSTQVVSSASDSDTVLDVDSPDVAVIEEDDLNLEELMRQKALLQARLGGIAMSDSESENSRKTPLASVNKLPAIVDDSKTSEKSKLKRTVDTSVSDVILLDDSSNDAPAIPKKKLRHSRSRSRERAHGRNNNRDNRDSRDNRDGRDNDKSSKMRRTDNENRFKEDLRKEIDRDKERSRACSPRRQSSSTLKSGAHSPNSKSRLSTNDKSKQTQSISMSSTREREVNKLGLKARWMLLFHL